MGCSDTFDMTEVELQFWFVTLDKISSDSTNDVRQPMRSMLCYPKSRADSTSVDRSSTSSLVLSFLEDHGSPHISLREAK